jgi:uncharacterized protein
MTRPPVPPFDEASAMQKVRAAEDVWNGRDPAKVALAYTCDCIWRNRAEFLSGRDEITAFLSRKWARELDYRLIKELWTFGGNRIAVRFAYEFADDGLMVRRIASINDMPISLDQRLFFWEHGPRPAEHPGLIELGL